MRKNIFLKFFGVFAVAFVALCAVSCSEKEVPVASSEVSVAIELKGDLPGLMATSGEFIFSNISTGTSSKVNLGEKITLVDGLYNVTFGGKGTYQSSGEPVDVNLQGTKQNVNVSGGTVALTVEAFVQSVKEDFVIAEIFGTGTYTPLSKQYNGDQFIRIFNNSASTLYADGLVILESKLLTNTIYDCTPNILDGAFAAQVVAMIPGSGTDYPVEPGKSIIVCDNAINHTEANVNSFDLSGADFEWYTESTSSANPDVDNPAVPNLDMLYNYTLTIWILTKQGNRAYAIGRIPAEVSREKYLADYLQTYTYLLSTGATSKEQKCYRFPESWLIDAVNISPVNGYAWNLTSPAVDMGFTYYGMNTTIAENVGKSVVRKVAYTTADGRDVLLDTNNSTVDFTPATDCSFLK